MIEMFLGLILVCDPNETTSCGIVRSPFHETQEECVVSMATEGMAYVMATYGNEVHIGLLTCIPVQLQGEPT